MLRVFFSIIIRDMKVILNSGTRIFMPVVYLLLILTFFSISLENTVIGGYRNILPQIIWLVCLLVSLLNMDVLYKDDFDDGTLEGIVINSELLEISILAKILSYWFFTIIPLVIVGVLMNLLLTGDIVTTYVLFTSLFVGTLAISLIGSIAASLTLSIKGNNLLLSTIVLPLDIPILIFGTSAVYNSAVGISYSSELLFLILLLILFLIVAPFASSFGLRNSLD